MTILINPVQPPSFDRVGMRTLESLRSNVMFDDPFVLPVSIYLNSNERPHEIIKNVIDVLRAYGFTDIPWVSQAPGSRYVHFKARHPGNDRKAASRSKKQLEEDLQSKTLPKKSARREPVKKLKQSLMKRALKTLIAVAVGTVAFVGGAAKEGAGDALKHAAEVPVKQWIDDHIPGKNQPEETEIIIVKLSPEDTASFHEVIEVHIDKSLEKTEQRPPPK
jgi:hypothetical protein